MSRVSCNTRLSVTVTEYLLLGGDMLQAAILSLTKHVEEVTCRRRKRRHKLSSDGNDVKRDVSFTAGY